MADPTASADDSDRGPAVLFIGGFPTDSTWYEPTRGVLLRRGATRVTIAPLRLWHWLAAAFVGLGPAASIVARAMDELSDEDGGRPILVVGHSGGGILARLALARKSFDGACQARPGAVGAVVTLGTPHLAKRVDGTFGYHGRRALRFLARHEAPPPPRPAGWLSIGSHWSADDLGTGWLPRLRRAVALVCYVVLLGAGGERAHGDGMVPLECAPLPGADHLRLEGLAHGPKFWGPRWYASDEGLDRWWGSAMEIWQRSLISGGEPQVA